VIGFPPGGGGDLYGRTIANELARRIGQPVVVDNRVGQAQYRGRGRAARPDSYTLLLAMSGNMGSAPAIRSNLSYRCGISSHQPACERRLA
jgi:tripartite-type tricarboxylate transporter receptor subunit TctC